MQELVREGGVRDDELPIDATNLVVNAGLHYIEHPDDTIRAAIASNYGDHEVGNVLGWFGVDQQTEVSA